MPKKIELLAPAGNMDSLKAAAAAGCNAVYLGLSTFSARAFAGNFSRDEFKEAISYCHIRGIKVYVTLNTLLFEEELENAVKEAAFLYENHADAVLVQDLGLFLRLRAEFPDLAVHCSTQMHIHNRDGALFMHNHGASRVVLARETPLELVKEISGLGVETEIFAYGALCISYSGQCLMSAALKNRSGNRGMCAQYCRMKYRTAKDQPYSYLLSPRDLNVIDHIPEIIEAGVSSLKIEGRMKRPEYVYLAVKTFREAIDAYYEGREYSVSRQRQKELLLMFNRGFTEGHLFHASVSDRMNHHRPNHQGITIGTVKAVKGDTVIVKLSDTLYQHDGLRILADEDIGLTADRILVNRSPVKRADAGMEVQLSYPSGTRPKPGQKLQKTTDAALIKTIQEEIAAQRQTVPVTIRCTARTGSPLCVTLEDEDGHTAYAESELPCEAARTHGLSHERLRELLSKTDKLPYRINAFEADTDDIFLPVSVINETRRKAFAALNEIRTIIPRLGRCEYIPAVVEKELPSYRMIIDHGTKPVIVLTEQMNITEHLPVTAENGYTAELLADNVIREIGALSHPLRNAVCGMTFNVTNSYAAEFLLKREGVSGIIVSSELNDRSLQALLDGWYKRHTAEPALFRLTYGRRTLMYIKNGFMQGNPSQLEDLHHEHFPVIIRNGSTEILENHPVCEKNTIVYGKYLIMSLELNSEQKEIQEGSYEEIFN